MQDKQRERLEARLAAIAAEGSEEQLVEHDDHSLREGYRKVSVITARTSRRAPAGQTAGSVARLSAAAKLRSLRGSR